MPVVALHPTVAGDYREQVAALREALASEPESRLEVIPKIRALIDRVVVTPAKIGRGVDIALEGRLAAILALATGKTLPAETTVTLERVKGIEPSS